MDQLNMFEFTHKELPIKKNIKFGTFFSGIGAPEMALKNIGVNYELQFFSEIDKYAISSYMAIHDEPIEKSVGSISDLKGIDLPYCDMWFGGFPCQDISIAGKGKGFALETESRSSLGWEMIRLASEVKVKPTYIVFENVPAIFNNTHRPILNLFKQDLEKLGYTLYNKLLNCKDYGIPQNRNRYFLVAILGEYSYKFPKKKKLELRLKDMLEKNVSKNYYINKKLYKKLVVEKSNKTLLILNNTTLGYLDAKYGDGLVLNHLTGGGFNNTGARGRIQKNKIPTIMATKGTVGIIMEDLRIREITSKEAFRLQGFSDKAFNKAKQVCSDSQLYKQAGNSIPVNVLEEIFTNLLLGGSSCQT